LGIGLRLLDLGLDAAKEDAMIPLPEVHHHWEWTWYLVGCFVTLVWKWQRYCYENKTPPTAPEVPEGCEPQPKVTYWQASRKWFEIETLGSQVSWGATVGAVWVLGTMLIEKRGAEWFGGGVLLGVPVLACMCFFIGALSEMIIPAFVKWIVKKFCTVFGVETQ